MEGDLKEGLEDRAYRLHYNKSQNRTDLFAQVRKEAQLGGLGALHAEGEDAAVPLRSVDPAHLDVNLRLAVPVLQVGMAFGGTVAAVALGPTPLAVISGASVGAALGVVSHMRTWDYAGEEGAKQPAKEA